MTHPSSPAGSVVGGMLLIAGSCIGAGMLALPILTGLAGFFPAVCILAVAWAFMTFTGLLLVEVNGWFKGQVNLVSMAADALGEKGRLIAWFSYLFLFYSLLVAYTVVSGSIFSAILASVLGWTVSPSVASIFFTLFFGVIIYLGTRPVDLLNRLLMIGLITAYLGMIGCGLFKIHPDYLLHAAPASMLLALPTLVVSFGFQNMIPSLVAYLGGDFRRMRLTILGGGGIIFVIYVVWIMLVLGVVEYPAILESYEQGAEATGALRSALGSSAVSHFAQGFAFFAIVTSFLAQGMTLTHFLADGFGTKPNRKNLLWFCSLAFLPPLVFALYYPNMFFKALNLAGGVFAMILFGILPVLMVWVGRYRRKHATPYRVFGGKTALLIALGCSLFVIICELMRK